MNEIIPFKDLQSMAVCLGKNKMFGLTSDDLLPLMLIAQAEGLHPATAAQEYDIIQGKPAIRSRAAQARFQSKGGHIKWTHRDDAKVSAIFSHPTCDPVEIVWTMERATKAQLTGKDNWKKYPSQMLSARVIAEGVRACFPSCLSSMYTVEEVQGFTDDNRPPEVIPCEVVETPPAAPAPTYNCPPGGQPVEPKASSLPPLAPPGSVTAGRMSVTGMITKVGKKKSPLGKIFFEIGALTDGGLVPYTTESETLATEAKEAINKPGASIMVERDGDRVEFLGVAPF